MAVVPQINYGAPVQKLALHDISGPGRVAQARASSLATVARANQRVVAANNQVAQYEFQTEQTKINSLANVKLAGLQSNLADIENEQKLVSTLFGAYEQIDIQNADQQVRDATLLYGEQLAKAIPELEQPYRSELINPNKPELGYKSVSNHDTLVERVGTATSDAEIAAMSGVTNPRARAALEQQFATKRVKALGGAQSTAEDWRVADHRINLGVSIDKAIRSGNLGAAEQFVQDGVKSNLLGPQETHDYYTQITQAKQVQALSTAADNLFDGRTPTEAMQQAENIHKIVNDPFSQLTAGQRAALSAKADGAIGDYWTAQVIAELNTPEAKSAPEVALGRLQDLAQRVLDIPSGKDGFATEKDKLRMHKFIIEGGSNIKTLMTEERARVKRVKAELAAGKKEGVAMDKRMTAIATERSIGDVNAILWSGKGTVDERILKAEQFVQRLKADQLLPDNEFPNKDLSTVQAALDKEIASYKGLAKAKEDLMDNAAEGQDEAVKNKWVGWMQTIVRNHQDDPISTWDEQTTIIDEIQSKTYQQNGFSSASVQKTFVGGLIEMRNRGKAENKAQIKADELNGVASDYRTGAAVVPLVGATSAQNAAFEKGYRDIGLDESRSVEQRTAEQTDYIVQQGKIPDDFINAVNRGLVSDDPNRFLYSVTRMIDLKAYPSKRGEAAYDKAYSMLSEDDKKLLNYGVSSLAYGQGNLDAEGIIDYRERLHKQDDNAVKARQRAFKSELKVTQGSPKWHETFSKLLQEDIDDLPFAAVPAPARSEFLSIFQREADHVDELGVASRTAYEEWKGKWSFSSLSGEWLVRSESPEAQVADGQPTPPWLKADFNKQVKSAGLSPDQFEGATPRYHSITERVSRPHDTPVFDTVRGTVWTDKHGAPITNADGQQFFYENPVYEESPAFKYSEAERKEAAHTYTMTVGRDRLLTLIRATRSYNPLADSIDAATAGNPDIHSVRRTSESIARELSAAADFTYQDNVSRSEPDSVEMHWVTREVRRRLEIAQEKGMSPQQAEADFKVIMDMINENAKYKRSAMYRQKQRDVDLNTALKEVSNISAGNLIWETAR